MGYYNVIQPCVVGGKHHVRPTTQPIEVDDDKAEKLVAAGQLEPYQPGTRAPLDWLQDVAPSTDAPRPIREDEPHSEGAVEIVAPEPESLGETEGEVDRDADEAPEKPATRPTRSRARKSGHSTEDDR